MKRIFSIHPVPGMVQVFSPGRAVVLVLLLIVGSGVSASARAACPPEATVPVSESVA